VQDSLRRAIVRLELAPGLRIDKAAVAAEFGISRQPVSAALARLAGERLVEIEPQSGTYVARIRLQDVIESAFVRNALETAAVRAIADEIDAATLGRLDANLEAQAAAERAFDHDRFYDLDLKFHALLFARLASPLASDIVDASRAQLERARRLLLPKPGRRGATFKEHRRIVERLAAHDAAGSAEAMCMHLQCGLEELKAFASERPDLFSPPAAAEGRA
jgi:DNA-binding GntR family transcriptional regulator